MDQVETLEALVAAGDRACARGDDRALAEIAHALRPEVVAPLQAELVAIESDPAAASRHWSKVSRCVRDWIASGYAHPGTH